MATRNSSALERLSSDSPLQIILTVTSSIALIGCLVAVVTKLALLKVLPTGWKCSMVCQDIAYFFLSLGLLLISCHVGGAGEAVCLAGGFFTLFGIQDIMCSLVLSGITFIFIQNPSKLSQLSVFRKNVFIGFVIPQKGLAFVLAALPVMPVAFFDTTSPYPLCCFPIRQEGSKGAAYGAVLIFLMWAILGLALSVTAVVSVRFWAGPGTRVHASSPSLWQLQKMEQSKSLHKFSILELVLIVVVMFMVTVVVYTNSDLQHAPQWAALLLLAIVVVVHLVLAAWQLFMWSGLCCDKTGQKKEPHHRLKQLELIRTEGPGKLRLKASWAAGKGVWKRGLLKVYGPEHIKAWAQEIVVLGLLRKSRSSSVLQCLWTSNTNPYHETMTLISGNIVTCDSRLTCLELTSIGTLQELLKTMDIPLPEPCQRTIMRDVAEGLSCLHNQNVLHRNLTSAAVYLKGSVQRLVLRAAIGDFEEAQIYGILTTGSSNSTISRKRFFFPDIRSYALVGIELLARVCECRQKDRQPVFLSALNISSDVKDRFGQSETNHVSHDENKRPSSESQESSGEVTELTSMIAYKMQDGVRRFENPEVPYCAPGEPEYTTKGKEKFPVDMQNYGVHAQNPDKDDKMNSMEHSHIVKRTNFSEKKQNTEYTIGNNWILQSRHELTAETKWEEYKKWEDKIQLRQTLKVAHGTKVEGINFQNFMAPSIGYEDLDKIEEEIERGGKRKFSGLNGHYQHGGYVTSVTDDGREIFIPATYKLQKSRGTSSSGYGSYAGSATQVEQSFSAGTANSISHSDLKQPHKSASIKITRSFEDVCDQTLPSVEDYDYTSRHAMRELVQAKEDEKVEQLISSYEERVKKGDFGEVFHPNLSTGMIFQGNSKEPHLVGPMLDVLALHKMQQSESRLQHTNHLETQTNEKSPARNQKIRKTNHKRVDEHEMRKANSTSFHKRYSRSSLTRNKARVALRKALNGSGFPDSQQLSKQNEMRGTKGKEVEEKYADHQRKNQKLVTRKQIVIGETLHQTSVLSNFSSNNNPIHRSGAPTENSESHSSHTRSDYVKDKSNNNVNNLVMTSTLGMASSKDLPLHLPHAYSGPTITPRVIKISNFGNSDTDNHRSRECEEESSTSVEPASTESEYADASSARPQTVAEKIEAEMNEIIRCNSVLQTGIKLIDSGFDSVSLSSEELCLCAASALQIPEDGSSSYPSQDRCSCACSSCLGSGQDFKQDYSRSAGDVSESWSNSNSFSSYDTNMYRRKLPKMRDRFDSPGGALAPDDQYPSPVHRGKTLHMNSLYPRKALPMENNRPHSYSGPQHSSSASETSSSASKRYKELLKRGVPLRVSIISGDENLPSDSVIQPNSEHKTGNPETYIAGHSNNKVISNLPNGQESEDTLANDTFRVSNEPTRSNLKAEGSEFAEEDEEEHYRGLSPIPSLEEIIREIPDETGTFPYEAKAFLNRPDSELSVKALQEVLSQHDSVTDRNTPKTGNAISSVFSHNGLSRNTAFRIYKGSLGHQDVIKKSESVTVETADLLSGVDGRHLLYYQAICSKLHIINASELPPTSSQSFENLKTHLQQAGNFGLIGKQMLDLISLCWLNENPPTTAAILSHLRDSITETEL